MSDYRKCTSCGKELRGSLGGSVCSRCLLQGVHEVLSSGIAAAPSGPPLPTEETVPGPVPMARAGYGNPDMAHAAREAPGRYTAKREHARGGMGRILLAHDEQLGRDVIIKELLAEVKAETAGEPVTPERPLRETTPMAARFVREARIAGQLEHPGIVPVHELGLRENGDLYYTMKFVRGRSMSEALRQASGLVERLKLLPHVIDVCQAVAYAHSRGVIHRDIKPANVMVGEFGETVIIDWGLARIRKSATEGHSREIDTGNADDGRQTMHGQVLGTPAYMAPEQAQGRAAAVDERTDIYALGALLYTLLTGQPPYFAARRDEILQLAAEGLPERVCVREPEAPPELVAICEKAMSSDPAQRYPSARNMAEELQHFQSGGLVAAYDYRFHERLRRFISRNRKVVATAGVALSIVIVLAIGAYARIAHEKNVAVEARNDALQARDASAHARDEATQARDEALRAREETDQQLYSTSIAFAQAAVETERPAEAQGAILAAPAHYRHWEWGFWAAQSHPELITLIDPAGHTVAFPAFSPDGSLIVSSDANGSLQLWDGTTGKLLRCLTEAPIGLTGPRFSPDGKLVEGIFDDGTLCVWEVETGRQSLRIQAHGGVIRSENFDPSGQTIATTAQDGTCKLWDVHTGQNRLTLREPDIGFQGVAFSHDGQRLVTSHDDGTARVWSAASGEQLLRLEGHKGFVRDVVVSPDGRWIATCSSDRTARIWDADTGATKCVLEGHTSEVQLLSFSEDSRRLYTGSRDCSVIIWTVPDGERVKTLRGFASRMGQFNAHSATGRIASHIGDPMATKSVVRSLEPLHDMVELLGHTGPITAIAFSPDSRLVATAAGHWHDRDDNRAIIWDAATGRQLSVLAGHRGAVNGVAFLADGERILTASSDYTAALWDIRSGQRLRTYNVKCMARALAVAPDTRTFMTAGWNDAGRVRVWDVATGRQVAVLSASVSPPGDSGTDHLAIANQGRYLAATSRTPAVVVIWDLTTSQVAKRLASTEKGRAKAMGFSPDGLTLVWEQDASICVWDTQTWEPIGFLTVNSPTAEHEETLRYHPRGGRLAACLQDGTVRLWDTTTKREVLRLNSLGPMAFSPDGRTLATGNGPTVVLRHAFPWREEEYPGTAEMALEHRIQLARQAREQNAAERDRLVDVWQQEIKEREECHARLLQLDDAKLAWAVARNRTPEDSPETISVLHPYLAEQAAGLTCPSGGAFRLGAVKELPGCSIHGSPHENPTLSKQIDTQKNDDSLLSTIFVARLCDAGNVGDLRYVASSWASQDRFHRSAIQLLRRATELNPEHKLAWYYLGTAELRTGLMDDAVAHFRQALEADQEYSIVALANALMARGTQNDLAEACTLFQQATELAPEKKLNLRLLGQAELRLGRVEEALAHFREGFETSHEPAAVGLALALISRGTEADLVEACATLEAQPGTKETFYTEDALKALEKIPETVDPQLRERIHTLLEAHLAR